MCIVNFWLVYKGNRSERECISLKELYSILAEQIVDKKYGELSARSDVVRHEESDLYVCGIDPNMSPTSRIRNLDDGKVTPCAYIGRCRVSKSDKNRNMCALNAPILL